MINTLMANNPAFGVLPEAQRNLLIHQADVRKLKKGQIIIHMGDVWPNLFFITRGSIQAHKNSMEGRSLLVTTFVKGDIFWGLAFFYDDMPSTVTLEAAEDSTLYCWHSDLLHPILKSRSEFSWEITRLMIHKMTRASEILEEMTFQPVAGRLAKLLMDTGRNEVDGAIARSLTLDEMAARIGSTREMVCRFLHRFADEKIIDITRTEYRITDRNRLTGLSQNTKG